MRQGTPAQAVSGSQSNDAYLWSGQGGGAVAPVFQGANGTLNLLCLRWPAGMRTYVAGMRTYVAGMRTYVAGGWGECGI